MNRVAVFVDSGYLFAQGSALVAGIKQTRTSVQLDAQAIVEDLRALALKQAPGCGLLRIYWYDGAVGGSRPTSEQALLAALDDVKLRLGFVNSHGQQKGVDSLIVTDLIELARQKSICDALLLSGDEDVRVGVQIAQNYGVRIHLLGIHPARGSQSQQLLHEADTTIVWNRDDMTRFLAVRDRNTEEDAAKITRDAGPDLKRVAPKGTAEDKIAAAVHEFVSAMGEPEIDAVEAYWTTDRGVPPDLDRRLLPTCGAALGRQLEKGEISHMRKQFRIEIKNRTSVSDMSKPKAE